MERKSRRNRERKGESEKETEVRGYLSVALALEKLP